MVLEVVGKYTGQLNGLNLATAFHRLAKCTSSQQIPEAIDTFDVRFKKIPSLGVVKLGSNRSRWRSFAALGP